MLSRRKGEERTLGDHERVSRRTGTDVEEGVAAASGVSHAVDPGARKRETHTELVSMSLNEGMSPLMILQKMQLSSVLCEAMAVVENCAG